jgi:hypothetical protein
VALYIDNVTIPTNMATALPSMFDGPKEDVSVAPRISVAKLAMATKPRKIHSTMPTLFLKIKISPAVS